MADWIVGPKGEMDPGCVHMMLTPSWREERLLLVRATDAIRLCRNGGHKELPRDQALPYVDDLARRDIESIRVFLAQTRLSCFPPTMLDNQTVLELLRGSIRCRDVVAVREGEGDLVSTTSATVALRRLGRKIEALTGGRLRYHGRQYKLVADVDLGSVPNRDSYQVVRQSEAIHVLDALEADPSTDPNLRSELSKARAALTNDWSPPLFPEGLVLLHRIILPQAVRPSVQPAITPSQMRAMLPELNANLEVVVLGAGDKPLQKVQFTIDSPDGEHYDGPLPSDGKTKLTTTKMGAAYVFISWAKPSAAAP